MGAAACAALCIAVAPVEAHDGEVHEGKVHETPSAAARPRTAAGSGSAKAVQRDATGAGRIETHSEAFELLVQADGGRLTIYLDRYADNAPVSDARLTVEAGGRALQALPQPDGSYRVELPPGARRTDLPLTVTVETAQDADLLVLDLPAERPAARAAPVGAGVEGAGERALDEPQGGRTQARGDGAGPGHAAADGADRGSGPPANRGDSPPASAWQRAALVAAALVALTALIPALIPLLRRARRKRAGEADAGRDAGRDAGGDGLRDDDHDDDHDDDRRPHRDDDREGHGDRHGRPRRPPDRPLDSPLDSPPDRPPHREDRPDASDGKGPPA